MLEKMDCNNEQGKTYVTRPSVIHDAIRWEINRTRWEVQRTRWFRGGGGGGTSVEHLFKKKLEIYKLFFEVISCIDVGSQQRKPVHTVR